MRLQQPIAIGLRPQNITAVRVRASGGDLIVEQVVHSTIPASIDANQPQAVGRFLAGELKSHGIDSRGPAIFAMPREAVSLKRLTLPTADTDELPDMARLAMQRDLPFDPAEAVIDFVTLQRGDAGTVVLVAAIQQQSLDYIRAVAKAAGLKPQRISLRCMGVTELLRTGAAVSDDQSAALVVDVTADGVEICVLTNGSIRFSRGAKIVDAEDPEERIDAIITEARRSWMSYRIVEDAPEVTSAFVLGAEDVADGVATGVSDLTRLRAEVISDHPRIDRGRLPLMGAWPLAGLLLEQRVESDAIDFMRPTRAPDRRARRRLGLFGAAAGIVLVIAMVAMFAARDIRDLETRFNEAAAAVESGEDGFFRYKRDYFRLEHLKRWTEERVDWIEHLAQLDAELPPRNALILDGMYGAHSFGGVDYDTRAKQWRSDSEIVFTIDGEAADQSIVDELRRSLAQSALYQVQSAGPDTAGGKRYPNPFKLTLRTRETSPQPDTDEISDEGAQPVEEGES